MPTIRPKGLTIDAPRFAALTCIIMRPHGFSEAEVLRLARSAYQTGKAGFSITTASCALLVIDMQDEFVKPNWTPFWVPEATRQVPRIKHLIEHCRTKEVPVIFTAFARTHNCADRPRSGSLMPNRYSHLGDDPSFFRDGHIWADIGPLDREIIILKPSYGAFYDTPLETVLKNLHRDTVIICGTLTNYCCGTTARQAYERGFQVVFGADVTATDDPDMQEPELRVIRKGFGQVMTCDEIIGALR
jgi:nicotinamidase-related amidase